jgi:CRP-like cAMP-binding protein
VAAAGRGNEEGQSWKKRLGHWEAAPLRQKNREKARSRALTRKVPAPEQAVNEAGQPRFQGIPRLWEQCSAPDRPGIGPGSKAGTGPVRPYFLAGIDENPDKTSPFLRISKVWRAHYDGGRTDALAERFTSQNWLAPMDTSHLAEHAGTAGTLFASVFLVSMTTMKTMIPLRVFGIFLNLVLIATAIPTYNYLVIVVQSVVLVLNSYRLHQMLQLIRDVRKSVNSDLSIDWLKPFMTEHKWKTGEILFYKDEKAEDMLYIVSGRFRLVESGIELPVGAIVGELGMLSPTNVRTQSLECIESGVTLSVSYSKVEELYVQNPEFGFYFLRLSSARLFENLRALEQRLAQQTALAKPA